MIAGSGQPAGAALAGVLADTIGVRPTVLLAALGAAVAFVAAVLSPLRDRDSAERTDHEPQATP